MIDDAPAPAPDPSPPAPTAPKVPRIPKVEDFPETGPNALASYSQRATGRVTDTVLFFVVPAFAALVVLTSIWSERSILDILDFSTPPPTEEVTKRVEDNLVWVFFGAVIFSVVYEVTAVAWKGRTVGKWMAGTRVARYADGSKPTVEQALLRCLLPTAAGCLTFWLTGSTVVGAMVVFASAYFNPLRRGWHDEAGGTVVVRTR